MIKFRRISLLLLLILPAYIFSQSPKSIKKDSLVLLNFFRDLTKKTYDKDKLYSLYFFQNQSNQPGRTENEIKFYKDTLFKELHDSLINIGVVVYSLQIAKQIFRDNVEYDYYYDLQKDKIFYVVTNDKKHICVLYALVVDKKIISLHGIAQDLKFIGWR